MPGKTVYPPGSTPAYLAILVIEAIKPERAISKTVYPPSSNPAYPVILVPEAINPGRAISYAWQNRVPT